MKVHQREIRLPSFPRGFHLITEVIEREMPEIRDITAGFAQVFIKHTSASLTLNENADPTVQSDIIRELDKIVPWLDGYDHLEGNSAAHIKASMMGFSHIVPVLGGRLKLGTWQGIYLTEFDGPRTRKVHLHFL